MTSVTKRKTQIMVRLTIIFYPIHQDYLMSSDIIRKSKATFPKEKSDENAETAVGRGYLK